MHTQIFAADPAKSVFIIKFLFWEGMTAVPKARC
jgi:hypothetical protein